MEGSQTQLTQVETWEVASSCAQLNVPTAEAAKIGLVTLDGLFQEMGIDFAAFCCPETLNAEQKADLNRMKNNQPAAGKWVDRLVAVLSDFAQKHIAAGITQPVLQLRLSGAEIMEPSVLAEDNPMMGLRGVSRYLHPTWREIFALQCRIVKRLRHVTGDLPLAIVVPFIRTYSDAASVHDLLAEHGLFRGKSGLQVYFMCDLPANALMADKFLHYFDGMVVDMAQLACFTAGIDPDNQTLNYAVHDHDAVLFQAQHALKMSRAVSKPCTLLMSESVRQSAKCQRWLQEQDVSRLLLG
ncbi:putative PEP-binding protein [Photobacterium sp. 1_MG-2023]|uniref:putative PEP-binding protein n=1 Tax=Photobacterium sp. 1_MG-2023 TaxID=3062646 RepID=UPI0026E34796|nr:putative PEP-binding protein [Photobacterium sp. 1_MG-2023]MDO6708409.1 phosphoenolpyruvate-utilizing protein [Photobacterium sp. 1_MG-2023]